MARDRQSVLSLMLVSLAVCYLAVVLAQDQPPEHEVVIDLDPATSQELRTLIEEAINEAEAAENNGEKQGEEEEEEEDKKEEAAVQKRGWWGRRRRGSSSSSSSSSTNRKSHVHLGVDNDGIGGSAFHTFGRRNQHTISGRYRYGHDGSHNLQAGYTFRFKKRLEEELNKAMKN